MKSSKDTIFYDFTTNLISQPHPYILRVLSGQRCLSDSVYMIPPEHISALPLQAEALCMSDQDQTLLWLWQGR